MSKQIKLQVPMDEDVLNRFRKRAADLGFDSAQAYIRVLAKAAADGRAVNFGDEWGEPSPEAAARLNRWAEEAKQGKNVSRSFDTVEELMEDLLR